MAGMGAKRGGQRCGNGTAQVGSSVDSQRDQARPQQIHRHRSAERCLRHTGRQSGVADAVTRTARRIYLFGKQVGETNIFVFGPNGEQIVSLDLAIERDVAGLEDYI